MPTTQHTYHGDLNQDHAWLRTWGTKVAGIPLILLFVISGMVAYQCIQVVHEQDQRVDHDRLVLATIGVVHAELYGAQAEAYSFVITGDVRQLQAFLQLRPQLSSNLDTLIHLLRGSLAQEGEVRTLRVLVPEELDALHDAVNLRASGATTTALQFVAGGSDDKVAATNQALIEALDSSVTGDLRREIAQATTTVRVTTLIILGVLCLDLALLAVIFFLVRQTIHLRERLARQQEQARAQADMEVLQETNRQMDDLIGIASHEFRTPLTTVRANLQLARRRILRTRDESAVLPLIDRAAVSSGRLERLADELLDVSRIKADTLIMRRVLVELGSLLRDCVSEQQGHHPDRVVTLHLPGVPALVFADPDRIRQVVGNYLGNAFKFSTEEKPIAVEMAREGEQVRVTVRDQGPGLPESEYQRIWERYQRAPGIERKTGSDVGLGLGLFISKTIISQHGGLVGVESEVGRGSAFYFTLPLAAAPEPSGQPDPSRRP